MVTTSGAFCLLKVSLRLSFPPSLSLSSSPSGPKNPARCTPSRPAPSVSRVRPRSGDKRRSGHLLRDPPTNFMWQMLRTKMEEELRCPACKRWFQSPLLLPCGHSMCTPCAAHALMSAEDATGAAMSAGGGSGGSGGSTSGAGGGDGPDIDGLSVVSEADSGVVCASSRPGSYVSSTSLGNIFLHVVQHGEQAVYGIVCLLCRKCALIGERGVDSLPRNRALEHIVEKFSQDADQPPKTRPCQLCDEKKERPAATLCEQCEIFYCEACLERCHPSRGPLAKHSLHPVAEGAEIIRKKRSSRQSRCNEHRQEPLSLYCLTCRCAVCCVCIQESHSRHEVQPLNTMCKGQKVSGVLCGDCWATFVCFSQFDRRNSAFLKISASSVLVVSRFRSSQISLKRKKI